MKNKRVLFIIVLFYLMFSHTYSKQINALDIKIQNTPFNDYKYLTSIVSDDIIQVKIRVHALERLVDLFFSVRVSGLFVNNEGKTNIFIAIQKAALIFRNDKPPYQEWLLRNAACSKLYLFESEKNDAAINTMAKVLFIEKNTIVKKSCLRSLGKIERAKSTSAQTLSKYLLSLLKQNSYSLIEIFEAKQAIRSLGGLNLKSSLPLLLRILESDLPLLVKRESQAALKNMVW